MQTRAADYVLLSYFGCLLVFGLLALSSAGVAVGLDTFKDSYFFLRHQVLYGVLPGLLLFFICARLDFTWWKKNATLIYAGTILLLIAVLIPGLGMDYDKGARSWLQLGALSFQPAEVAKLGLIIFLAAFLTKKGKQLASLEMGFIPSLIMAGLPIGLILLQPDLGTAIIFLGIVIAMLFVGGARWPHLGSLCALGVVGVIGLAFLAPYRLQRLTTFLHPELDPQGVGYQINQGFLAIGSGGWLGLGLGHSRQKFQYLPEVQADSIFAIISEELGFIVAAALVILLILIALRSFRLAKAAPDTFAQLLVAGIASWFIIQSFLNIGAMVGILPLTGVPLPFVSHGGTALMVGLAAVGILINVSKYREE